jgi:6-phosphofructokinase 1
MKAVELIMEEKFGNMVTLKGNDMAYDSLENVIGKIKNVNPQGELVTTAKNIGISFGE